MLIYIGTSVAKRRGVSLHLVKSNNYQFVSINIFADNE